MNQEDRHPDSYKHGPSKTFPTKGLFKGLCNVGACMEDLSDIKNFKHRLSNWHYCGSCASGINRANMDWGGYPLCVLVEDK